MAVYTNDLRLKEIATGDDDGTWGTATNTNLSLIADAFGYGTKQFAADADETFTMPDATADGTRALYLKFTSAGSLTATRTATLAPNTVSKVWIIENATTGSQSIIIKQGSGATVTVASGAKVFVYSDGAGSGAAVVGANPTAATGGTVTSVAMTAPSFLTVGGSPVTSSGTLALTLSGTALPVTSGGLGVNTITGVMVGNGTSAVSAAVSGTDVKTINGSSILGSGNLTTATGALIYLSVVNASGASTVDVETGFGATYENYLIVAEGIVLSGADSFLARWKLGGSYVTTSTYISASDTTGTGVSTTQAFMNVFNNSITTSGSFEYFISNVNSAIAKTGRCIAQGVNATPSLMSGVSAHYNTGTGALTGIRFYCNGGATITGKFRLYGIATS